MVAALRSPAFRNPKNSRRFLIEGNELNTLNLATLSTVTRFGWEVVHSFWFKNSIVLTLKNQKILTEKLVRIVGKVTKCYILDMHMHIKSKTNFWRSLTCRQAVLHTCEGVCKNN